MNWKCRHCGWKAPTETSCCFAHWEEAAAAKTWRVLPGIVLLCGLLALGIVKLIEATQ